MNKVKIITVVYNIALFFPKNNTGWGNRVKKEVNFLKKKALANLLTVLRCAQPLWGPTTQIQSMRLQVFGFWTRQSYFSIIIYFFFSIQKTIILLQWKAGRYFLLIVLQKLFPSSRTTIINVPPTKQRKIQKFSDKFQ